MVYLGSVNRHESRWKFYLICADERLF